MERAAASHSHPRAIFFHRVAFKRLRRATALVFYVRGPWRALKIEVQLLLEMFIILLLAALRH